MEKPFITKIESTNIHHEPGEYEADYYMSGRDCLAQLSNRPDLAPHFKGLIEPKDFKRLGDPKFQESVTYQNLVRHIDDIVKINRNTTEQELLPLKDRAVTQMKKYLEDLDLSSVGEELEKRVADLSIIFLDVYHFWANVVREQAHVEASAFYSSTKNTVVMTLARTHTESAQFDQLPDGEQMEVGVKPALLHELFHGASYRNLWLLYTRNSDRKIDTMETLSRRIGVANTRSGDNDSPKLTGLNEAITQKLTIELLPRFLDPNLKPEIVESIMKKENQVYKKERELLYVLMKTIDWRTFVKAYFTKEGLLELGRELKEKTGMNLSELDI